MQKNENRLCPLPYEEVLEDIIKTGWAKTKYMFVSDLLSF